MNKLMSKTVTLGGALTAVALLGATPAQAAYLSDVHVEVSWRGSNCLSFYGPIEGDRSFRLAAGRAVPRGYSWGTPPPNAASGSASIL